MLNNEQAVGNKRTSRAALSAQDIVPVTGDILRSQATAMMGRGVGRFASSRLFILAIGMIAFSLQWTLATFLLLDAVCLSISQVSFHSVATTAATFDLLALVALLAVLVSRTRKREGRWLQTCVLPWACVSATAAAIMFTLGTLVLKKTESKEVEEATKDRPSVFHLNLPMEFGVWALAFVSQAVFYAMAFKIRTPTTAPRRPPPRPARSPVPSQPDTQEVQQRSLQRPTELKPPTTAPGQAALPSPTFSHSSKDDRRNSWRSSVHSLHRIVRPVTSRTRLIGRHHPSAQETRSSVSETRSMNSFRTVSQPDAFDSWDTSAVDQRDRDAVMQSPPPAQGRALETIPGSRPGSPGRPLDGPFPPSPTPSSPIDRPPTAYSTHSQLSRVSSNQTLRASRPTSPSIHEAHIHPLFRTDSPTPPPARSAGTVVVASPYSGSVIQFPSRPPSRVRSDSRTTSPSPLTRSAIQSHVGSSRSSSPPSRSATPPIPEFVLSASNERVI